MKLLVDMNLSPKILEYVKTQGVESEHWFKIGKPDASDSEIMKYAVDNNYVVLTCDLDFSTILSATGDKKPSVIQLRLQAFDMERVASIIVSAVKQNEDIFQQGAVISINAKKTRIRVLPF